MEALYHWLEDGDGIYPIFLKPRLRENRAIYKHVGLLAITILPS